MTSIQMSGVPCGALGSNAPTFKAHPNRKTHLGDLPISRALPIRERRMVGPWCFLDRFGPLAFGDKRPMEVPPHPHIGLQTVSWLLEGEILHTDSLGSEALLSPDGVNVMTAGRGIAHAEETPAVNSGRLSGVQLWAALPDEQRGMAPSFTHIPQVPLLEVRGGVIQIFAGDFNGMPSPAPHFSGIIGMDVTVHPHATITLELSSHFEYAALLLDGDCTVEKQPMAHKTLYTLGTHRASLDVSSQSGGRVLVIGGTPFPEEILMWWNFVARTPEEIRDARADWEAGRRFGDVPGTDLPRLSAPDLAFFARPNPAS